MDSFLSSMTESWFLKYFFAHLGWVDWLLFAFILVGMIVGLRNRLVKEVPRLLESLVSLGVSFEVYSFVSDWLTRETPLPESYGRAITFGLIWFLSWLGLRLVFEILGKLVHLEAVEPLSSLGGLLFGAARYFLLFCLISYFLVLFPLDWIHQSYQVQSWSGQTITQIPPKIHEWASYWAKGFLGLAKSA